MITRTTGTLTDRRAATCQARPLSGGTRRKQMAAPGLAEPAKKALATLDREWHGLAAHRGYPMISLDNNAAERALRLPVVTRKNAYGSRNGESARLAARIWTVTATAEMAGGHVLTYLTAYFDACGRNGGRPPGRPRPGTVPALARRTRRPQSLGETARTRITAPQQPPQRRHPRNIGHACRWHAQSRDFRILRAAGTDATAR